MAEPARRTDSIDQLHDEVTARRDRIADNLDELGMRLRPQNLLAAGVAHARSGVTAEVDRVTDLVRDFGADLIEDSLAFASEHRRPLLAGAAALALGWLGWRLYSRRTAPIPLYAAYDMEDPDMMNELDTAKAEGARILDRVKDEAGQLGDKASEAYYSARSKAADLADDAREKAREAADIAREKAHEAAEAAREAALRAREAAGDAGRWAKRQPQDNPMTVVLVAFAAGALLAALMPTRGGRDA